MILDYVYICSFPPFNGSAPSCAECNGGNSFDIMGAGLSSLYNSGSSSKFLLVTLKDPPLDLPRFG